MPAVLILSNIIVEISSRRTKNGSDTESRAAQSAKANAAVGSITLTVSSAVFALLNFALLYIASSSVESTDFLPFDFMGITVVLLGIVLVVMGNYMPKTKKNSLIGFRCAWTKYNDVTWQKSNRFAAYVMMAAGVVSILCGLIFGGIASMIVLFASILVSAGIMLAYSYRIYKEETKNDKIN